LEDNGDRKEFSGPEKAVSPTPIKHKSSAKVKLDTAKPAHSKVIAGMTWR
jgi:hypothetical protein